MGNTMNEGGERYTRNPLFMEDGGPRRGERRGEIPFDRGEFPGMRERRDYHDVMADDNVDGYPEGRYPRDRRDYPDPRGEIKMNRYDDRFMENAKYPTRRPELIPRVSPERRVPGDAHRGGYTYDRKMKERGYPDRRDASPPRRFHEPDFRQGISRHVDQMPRSPRRAHKHMPPEIDPRDTFSNIDDRRGRPEIINGGPRSKFDVQNFINNNSDDKRIESIREITPDDPRYRDILAGREYPTLPRVGRNNDERFSEPILSDHRPPRRDDYPEHHNDRHDQNQIRDDPEAEFFNSRTNQRPNIRYNVPRA